MSTVVARIRLAQAAERFTNGGGNADHENEALKTLESAALEFADTSRGQPRMLSLYKELVAAGQELGHHNSDLHVLSTPEARAIVVKHRCRNVTGFISAIDGKFWLDIPFAYEPFWDGVARKEARFGGR